MHSVSLNSNPLESFSLAEVTELLQQLTELMKMEIDFLQNMRVREINPIQSKKHKLASELEDCQRRFAGISAEMRAGIPVEEKAKYHDVLMEFQKVSQDNQLIISVAQEVNMNVVETIKRAVKEANSVPLYGHSGGHNDVHDGLFLSLNQTV